MLNFLKSIKSFDKISPWILYHHERIDGKGYYNIKAEDIPFVSKVLAVCDTYSAITMRRSYKASRTHEEAIEILKSVKGTQLDSELVDIFITIPKEELESCNPDRVNELKAINK